MTHPFWRSSSDKTADLSNLKKTMRSIYNRCTINTEHWVWRLPGVHYCKNCEYEAQGVMDYIYGTWWKCRDCGAWGQKNA